MRRWLKRLAIKFKLLRINRSRSRSIIRSEERANRRKSITAAKHNFKDDLMTGESLQEFVMMPEDKKLLYKNPNYDSLYRMYKKYRGYKVSEHPSIYKPSA